MLTMKKAPHLTVRGAEKEFIALDENRKEVGRVYQRRVTKDVFRQGQHMRVPVLGWFYRLGPDSPEVGMQPSGPEWVSMSDAVGALALDLR